MNIVTIVGNLGSDPDIRQTKTGKVVATLSVAIPKRVKNKETNQWDDAPPTWITTKVWGHTAEYLQKHARKGKKICIQGELDHESWQDKESGQNRSKLIVVARQVHLVEIPQTRSDYNGQGYEPALNSPEDLGYQNAGL